MIESIFRLRWGRCIHEEMQKTSDPHLGVFVSKRKFVETCRRMYELKLRVFISAIVNNSRRWVTSPDCSLDTFRELSTSFKFSLFWTNLRSSSCLSFKMSKALTSIRKLIQAHRKLSLEVVDSTNIRSSFLISKRKL